MKLSSAARSLRLGADHGGMNQSRPALAAKPTAVRPARLLHHDPRLDSGDGSRRLVGGTDPLCAGGLEGYAEGVDPWFVP